MAENNCSWYDIPCQAGWLSEELKSVGVWFYEKLVAGVGEAFALIPVPEFLQVAGTFELPAGVLFFMGLFELKQGLTIVCGAYVARFLVRRIPLIG